MTIRATRRGRLLVAAMLALLGLALGAPAAFATYRELCKPQGRIKVIKKVVAAPGQTDTGRFNLLVDGETKAADVGDGGATPYVTLDAGDHTIGETAVAPTSLGDYTASTLCIDKAYSGRTDGDGQVKVGDGDEWVCTITNTRKSTPPPDEQQPPVEQQPPDQPQLLAEALSTPAPTVPARRIKVSPARVRPGSAKLTAPSGCARTTRTIAATVTGRQIVRVTFSVDGRKVRTLTKPNARGGRWTLPITVRRLAVGTHRVSVTVRFARSSQTKTKTLRLSFNRCSAAPTRPKFTG